jgi:hypothetical protein
MTPGQQSVAEVLAAARQEALEERPLGCAILNSVIRRLAVVYTEQDPGFDAEAFRAAADYYGLASGTTGTGFLPP